MLERTARRQEREIRGLRWLVVNGNQTVRPAAQTQAVPPPRPTTLSDSEGPLSDGTTDVGSARGLRGFESDTAALGSAAPYMARRQPASRVYSSASETSGPELSARARSPAMERARAAREQADRVLARGGPTFASAIEFSVAIDVAAEVESAGGHGDGVEVEVQGERWEESRRSSESTTPTSPVSPAPVSVPVRLTQEDEARRQKEERRASRVLKRLSLMGVSEADSNQDALAKHSMRGQPTIEQVMDVEQELERLTAVVKT
jgi:hypothetical protein